jgi:hypothetical protein
MNGDLEGVFEGVFDGVTIPTEAVKILFSCSAAVGVAGSS